jgi:hypothetical protein
MMNEDPVFYSARSALTSGMTSSGRMAGLNRMADRAIDSFVPEASRTGYREVLETIYRDINKAYETGFFPKIQRKDLEGIAPAKLQTYLDKVRRDIESGKFANGNLDKALPNSGDNFVAEKYGSLLSLIPPYQSNIVGDFSYLEFYANQMKANIDGTSSSVNVTIKSLGAGDYGEASPMRARGLGVSGRNLIKEASANTTGMRDILTQLMILNPGLEVNATPASFKLANQYKKLFGFVDGGGEGSYDWSHLKIQGVDSIKRRPFSMGGIVTAPTNALIGEAGPEAVIPLERFGGMFGGRTQRWSPGEAANGKQSMSLNSPITIVGAGDNAYNIAQRTVNSLSRFQQLANARQKRIF